MATKLIRPTELSRLISKHAFSQLVLKAPYVTQSHLSLQPRQSKQRLNRSDYALSRDFGVDEGFNTSAFGSYQLVVPQKLKLGVDKVNVDQLVPANIARPPYAYTKEPNVWATEISIKNEEMLEKMRLSGQLAKKTLKLAESLCVVS